VLFAQACVARKRKKLVVMKANVRKKQSNQARAPKINPAAAAERSDPSMPPGAARALPKVPKRKQRGRESSSIISQNSRELRIDGPAAKPFPKQESGSLPAAKTPQYPNTLERDGT